VVDVVIPATLRSRRLAESPQVRSDRTPTAVAEKGSNLPPEVGSVREAMKKKDRRAVTLIENSELKVADGERATHRRGR
jgi:hypothetical protein